MPLVGPLASKLKSSLKLARKFDMKKFLQSKKLALTGVVTALAASSQAAFAELPAAATAAFAAMDTAVSDTETAVWGPIAAAIVMFVIIRLVKRGANKI